jgi:hypothetical protein
LEDLLIETGTAIYLLKFYSSPNIIMHIKSRRMRWAGHVVWEKRGKCKGFLVGNPKGRRPLGKSRQ